MSEQKNNKEIIIENALKLFYENGYKDTTLRKIAEKCDIAHPSIFNHFKTKAEIASILLHRYVSSLTSLTQKYVEENGMGENGYNAYLFYWNVHFYCITKDHNFYDYLVDYVTYGDWLSIGDGLPYFEELFKTLMGFDYKRTAIQYKVDDHVITNALTALEKACSEKHLTIVEAIFELTEIIKAVTRIKIRLKKSDIVRFVETLDYDRYINFDLLEHMILTRLGAPFPDNGSQLFD